MLVPDGTKTLPITLSCDKDVEILTSVRDYMSEAVLYVTSGPELVAKYEFLRRSPFIIGDTTYLEEGVSEAQHRQAILDLVGGHPIVCSKHILEIMFNEPQLIVFHVALDIEMVYGLPNDDVQAQNATEFPRLTVDDVISMAEAGVAICNPNWPTSISSEPFNPSIEVEPLNVWRDMTEEEEYWDGIAAHENDYEVLNLGILTPVALTYQLPDWMLVPDGTKTLPITLSCDKDVEILTSVRDYMSEAVLYVTSGPELVAKYEFLRRSPFIIGDTTYLEEGVSEAQHRQAILDLVGGHPIVCSKRILEIMFNGPQLLIVFHVALDIEMVYGLPNDDVQAQDATEFPRLTVDDVISMAEAGTISPEEEFYYAENDDEVLYGEPMTIEELQYAIPIGQPASLLNHSTPLEVGPLNVWRDMTEEEEYWDGIAAHENDYEVYYAHSTHPT
ncbi:hypothetical protein F2Q70_00031050 [Brassica cretica]|uniref:Uncharacterized protein n=1 Tax=Brassica cretica TaxID=69181 RepID=A0A8S9FG19_BRACR|nr:hypothetical protein F2Q70_00031050 [Brassica cretica]